MRSIPAGTNAMVTTIDPPQTLREEHSNPRDFSARPASKRTAKRIWIDLDNSPHVPFFLPIIDELQNKGYRVFVTARNSYQVCELLRLHNLSCQVVGKHYGKKFALKLLGTALRTAELLPLALTEKPDLAVSHTSRAQFLVASLLGIPSVVMFDYEFANTTGFMRPDWTFVPGLIPQDRLSQDASRMYRYEGLKEDVYVPGFRPDPNFRKQLGIPESEMIVTVRPPATEAHYHNPESDQLFEASLRYLLAHPDVRVILLPRNDNQGSAVRSQWAQAVNSGRILIPERAVAGLDLIWISDLVISGGGTMNREAAALGVPVYSIFRGRIGGVDQYLAETGRLTLIEEVDDIPAKIALQRRTPSRVRQTTRSVALNSIVDAIISIAEDKCLPTSR